jgi:hypothetical protein
LDQTATLRSVMLLAGPNDVGKSALVGRWLSRLDRRFFCPLLLTHASLSGCGLLWTLAAKPGQRATFRREANLALIVPALTELGKIVPLIIMDEAPCFGYGSLEEARLLLGLNLADPQAFGLVLIGDKYLLGILPCASTARSFRASPATGAWAFGLHRCWRNTSSKAWRRWGD